MGIPELGVYEGNAHGPYIVVIMVARSACPKVMRISPTTNPRRCLQDRDVYKAYEMQHHSCRKPRCASTNNANGLIIIRGDFIITNQILVWLWKSVAFFIVHPVEG